MNERPINSGTLIALKYWKYQEQFKEFIINAQSQLPPKVREALENQLTREASKKILQNQIDWNTPEAKTALLLAPDGYDDVLRDRYLYDLIANSNLPESMKDALSEISGTDNIKNLLPQVITLLNLPEYMRDTLLASDIPDEFLFSWNAETFSNTESLLQQMEQFIIQFSEKLDVHKRVLTEELDKLEDWVQQMEQSRSSHDANASSESGASSFTTPTSGDSDATSDGKLSEVDEVVIELFNAVPSQKSETRQDETGDSDSSLSNSKDNTEVRRGYMQHSSTIIPSLAHLTVQQMRKLDLVSSLFPNIPRETVMEQLMLPSSEQSTNPGLAAIRESYPGPIRQNFEAIVQYLTDDQISFEDFQTRFENFQTHLEEDPRYIQILEAIMTRPNIETRYAEVQERLNQATERLRDEHPELVNEIEEHRAVIDGTLPSLDNILNTLQSEVEMNAAGTPGALEIPSAEVIVVQALYNATQDDGAPLPREESRDFDASSVADDTEGVYPQNREEFRILIQEVDKHINKWRLLDSLFPDIPPSTLAREFTVGELLEGRANPDLAAILDEGPGYRQNLEAILQGLTDTEISVEDFRTRVEELRTLLDANPSYETALTAALNETLGEKAEIFLNQLIEAFRNRYPVISEELEEYYRAIREYIERLRDRFEEKVSESGEEAQWFVQWDDSYLDNLLVPLMKELPHRLDEIENQLSDSQHDDLEEIRDAFPKDAAWHDKVSHWFSTLDEGSQKNIQDAYKISNPPTVAQVAGSSDTFGQKAAQTSNTEESVQQNPTPNRSPEPTKSQDGMLSANHQVQAVLHGDSQESTEDVIENNGAKLPAKVQVAQVLHSGLLETQDGTEGETAKLRTPEKPIDVLPIEGPPDSSDSA